ncbi:hypothetical protein CGC49_09225 [Capnocytophaga sp. H4358]|uniref:FRG domain-containing protein n=1 Tax=Capnocytophaga sp. H4358 TaxID=1945658 RepID=UPI000BB1F312|nr:FRG domain-containing protein [Capnocytophaga sp. H4358]ATA73437.1 hypothetical protein CGC49_09225 [Capnocytophaga sp. H4358]
MAKRQNKKLEKKGNKVTSIETYLSQIKTISVSENTFYRGHSDKNYKLEPSIYRKDSLIKNEHLIYRETISKVPYDFNGKSTIESLVLMQHYGVPTRILDLTTNALVALYFACIDNKDRDGEIIIFDVPQKDTCYFDSDRVTVLANLAKCDNEFCYGKLELDFLENCDRELKTLKQNFNTGSYDKDLDVHIYTFKESLDQCKKTDYKVKYDDFKKEIDNFKDKESNLDENLIKQVKYKLTETLWIKNRTFIDDEISEINEYYFGYLLHYIKEDKSYFKPIIDPNDIGKVFAIKPKLDNPRIVRQHGAFLIFGVKENNKEMPQVPSEWIKTKIGIDAKSKEDILKELFQLGIDKSTLFPEIDKVAEYIKEKFQNQ